MRIGVATCAAAPQLDEDRDLLLPALACAGVSAVPVVWSDRTIDWNGFDGVFVRSVWDYPTRHAAFLDWLRRCPATANPDDVIVWNSDKRYLDDLNRAGVATVPTIFLPPGQPLHSAPADFVVKPAISGSAADTGRFRSLDHGRGGQRSAETLIARLHGQGRTAMVQPYVPGIDLEGETSIIFLAGRYSHAVRRQPLLTARGERRPVVVADVLSTIRPVAPTTAQVDLADMTLDAVPGGRDRLSYARVDLIPGSHGPLLLELEVIDCFLFLSHAGSGAIGALVDHVVDQLGRRRHDDP